MHRNDMKPEDALIECFYSWASGAWQDDNATYNLEEIMNHIERMIAARGLVGVSTLDPAEVCPECGMPDNCGDCNHTLLSTEELASLGLFEDR